MEDEINHWQEYKYLGMKLKSGIKQYQSIYNTIITIWEWDLADKTETLKYAACCSNGFLEKACGHIQEEPCILWKNTENKMGAEHTTIDDI